jgi:hypothetical protein
MFTLLQESFILCDYSHIRGELSFDYLKNVSGVMHQTFQLACKNLGLLEDDK